MEEGTQAQRHEGTQGRAWGANRVARALGERLKSGQKGLMPFICGGYPTLETTRSVLPALGRAGADVVEVGIPFSDPIADGPTIASAMQEALRRGVKPQDVFAAVRAARDSGRIEGLGIVAMVSISIVWRMGIDRFIDESKRAGFDGYVFPDVPLEESGPLLEAARLAGQSASLLVAPTTSPDRAAAIAGASTGFVYVLARMGITGEQRGPQGASRMGLRERIKALRDATEEPIACGFGISDSDGVRNALGDGGADAAIVGSALVRRMGRRWKQGDDPVAEAETFIRSLRMTADRS